MLRMQPGLSTYSWYEKRNSICKHMYIILTVLSEFPL